MARFGSAIVCALAMLAGLPLRAQPQEAFEHRVLLDTDHDLATGCGVAVKDAAIDTTITGVDHLVVVRVERTSQFAAQVVAIGRRICVGGSFGPEIAVDAGDWPVGLDNGRTAPTWSRDSFRAACWAIQRARRRWRSRRRGWARATCS